MNQTNHLSSLRADCETAIQQITQRLERSGIRAVRSFDLRSACASFPDLACLHHGTVPCDCQLVVLLAYQGEDSPASIIVHSHNGQTEAALAHSPDHPPGRDLEAAIRSALSPLHVDEWTHVP